MRVLVFTNMYPTEQFPFYGSFVRREAESLRDAGVDVDVYFVNGRANRLNYFGMPAGFSSRLKRFRPDIVHVHHSYCGLIATMQKRVPVVWTFHEGEIASRRGSARNEALIKQLIYWRGFKRHVASRVTRLIVVADFLAAQLGRADTVTIPAGVDMENFRPLDTAEAKTRLNLNPNRRYILFPSSPDRVEKRFPLAQAAVQHLKGDPDSADIELLCLDRVPFAEVPLYMNASELMLMTSAFEASPVTIREALACNVPVLSTDIGDARSVLEGIDGCAVVSDDPAQIAIALRKALSQPRRVDARTRMETYSLPATARKLTELYRGILETQS